MPSVHKSEVLPAHLASSIADSSGTEKALYLYTAELHAGVDQIVGQATEEGSDRIGLVELILEQVEKGCADVKASFADQIATLEQKVEILDEREAQLSDQVSDLKAEVKSLEEGDDAEVLELQQKVKLLDDREIKLSEQVAILKSELKKHDIALEKESDPQLMERLSDLETEQLKLQSGSENKESRLVEVEAWRKNRQDKYEYGFEMSKSFDTNLTNIEQLQYLYADKHDNGDTSGYRTLIDTELTKTLND